MNSILVRSDTQVYFAMVFDFINKFGLHLESTFDKTYTVLPLIVPISAAFSGTAFAHRISEAIDTLRILRGELVSRNRQLLDASLDWCRSEKLPSKDLIISKSIFLPSC